MSSAPEPRISSEPKPGTAGYPESDLHIFPQEPHVESPDLSWPSVVHYAKTRVTELLPTGEYISSHRALLNPIPGIKEITGKQWLFILCGAAAWTWDAFDFFCISLNIDELADELQRTVTDITWSITLVLMFRSLGAFVFGYFGDKYGNKWPFIANLILMMIIQIGVSFIKTFKQFLAVRALFGFVMGGIYGNATSLALDDCPARAKGFISGLIQQGYALGYLLAVVFTRAIADNTSHGWRALYWFAAGVTFLIICSRAVLPQTDAFIKKRLEAKLEEEAGVIRESFEKKAARAMKGYWLMMIYLILLMSGFNFMSHGSQDLYPTYLNRQLNFGADRSTVTNCVANLGAITGGLIVGHFSSVIGRRLSIILCCILGGALIYPWAFVHTTAINAGAFFLQFGVQGAFGVIPAHLSELAHPDYKSFIVGISYQLGNLASSASSTIESTIGEQFPIINPEGKEIIDYGKVMAIFVGAVFAYVVLVTFAGPERRAIDEEIEYRKEVERFLEDSKVNKQHLENV